MTDTIKTSVRIKSNTSSFAAKLAPFGKLVLTAGINHHLANSPERVSAELTACFNRHVLGDWGDVSKEDAKQNDWVVKNKDGRLLSSYKLSTGQKIWIITSGYGTPKSAMDLETYSEADYTNTVIMFPSEY